MRWRRVGVLVAESGDGRPLVLSCGVPGAGRGGGGGVPQEGGGGGGGGDEKRGDCEGGGGGGGGGCDEGAEGEGGGGGGGGGCDEGAEGEGGGGGGDGAVGAGERAGVVGPGLGDSSSLAARASSHCTPASTTAPLPDCACAKLRAALSSSKPLWNHKEKLPLECFTMVNQNHLQIFEH
ncbi:hypothetical protein R5R35_004246 [Gryllus longicercus]|uniref:Uncharacterized protein n=1 Tax=Gryllus longicercus TaxID=2509291 RepID=A0AAN9W8X3_9ORTH